MLESSVFAGWMVGLCVVLVLRMLAQGLAISTALAVVLAAASVIGFALAAFFAPRERRFLSGIDQVAETSLPVLSGAKTALATSGMFALRSIVPLAAGFGLYTEDGKAGFLVVMVAALWAPLAFYSATTARSLQRTERRLGVRLLRESKGGSMSGWARHTPLFTPPR